jgi:restriction system protein
MKIVLYLVLLVFVALAIYYVVRRRPGGPAASRLDRTLFGNDTTAFQSQLDSRMADAPAPAGDPMHRGLQPPAATWNAQVFRDIEWQRFEAVCSILFAEEELVSCRHSPEKPVGNEEMREFRDVVASHKLHRGTFVTSGTFTAQARDFAKSNGISPLDGLALLALISRRTAEQQKELLRIAYEGEYWRPTCASCGLKMVERSEGRKGALFWGCADYPRCQFTLPIGSAD